MIYRSFFKNKEGDLVRINFEAEDKKTMKNEIKKIKKDIDLMKRGFYLVLTEPSDNFIMEVNLEETLKENF